MARPDLLVHQVAKRSSVNHPFQHNIVKRSHLEIVDRNYNDGAGNFIISSRMIPMLSSNQNDQTLELELATK
jgi:hypothetical protein